MIYSSNSIFLFNVLDALDHTEVLPATVILHHEQASSIHVLRVHIHHKMLQPLQLSLSIIMITQKLLDLIGFSFLKRNVVGISAKDIFELTLQFVNIVIVSASKLKLYFFVLGLSSLLFFGSFIEIFSQIVDDSVVMVSMFLPKFAELLGSTLANCQLSLSNLQSCLN